MEELVITLDDRLRDKAQDSLSLAASKLRAAERAFDQHATRLEKVLEGVPHVPSKERAGAIACGHLAALVEQVITTTRTFENLPDIRNVNEWEHVLGELCIAFRAAGFTNRETALVLYGGETAHDIGKVESKLARRRGAREP